MSSEVERLQHQEVRGSECHGLAERSDPSTPPPQPSPAMTAVIEQEDNRDGCCDCLETHSQMRRRRGRGGAVVPPKRFRPSLFACSRYRAPSQASS